MAEDFTAEDFAIPLAQELLQRQFGTDIGAKTARDMIFQRLTGVGSVMDLDRDEGEAASTIARLIVKALPDEAMYANIVGSLDLRPYLNVVLSKTDKRLPDMFHDNWRPKTQALMDRIQGDYVAQVADQAGAGSEDAAAMAQQVTQFNPDLVTIDPLSNSPTPPGVGTPPGATAPVAASPEPTTTTSAPIDPATGAPAVDTSKPIDVSGAGVVEGPAPGVLASFAARIASPSWDPEDLRELVKAGVYQFDDPENVLSRERPDMMIDPTTGQPVLDPATREWGPLGLQVSGAHVGDALGRRLPKGARSSITAVQALHWLKDQTEEEVAVVQEKMEAAGMLERGAYDRGNAWDEATGKAWRGLLSESYQRNAPTNQVLDQQIQRRRTQVAQFQAAQVVEEGVAQVQWQRDVGVAHRRALQPANPGELRMIANDYAQSMIGRDLTPKELLQMAGFVGRLAHQAADDFAKEPAGPAPVDPADRAAGLQVDPYLGFQSKDIEQQISETMTPEVRQNRYNNLLQAKYDRFGSASPDKIAERRGAMNPRGVV